VTAKLIKHQKVGGKRETWTVIEPVVRALRVAERFTPDTFPMAVTEFRRRYGNFTAWLDAYGEQDGLSPIPTDWELEVRQFRRTLARELGWRPGGVIAGKIHLKHISVLTTEGYVGKRGESASSFLAEVEAERRLANLDAAEKAIAAVERGEPVLGLGAKALAAAVAEIDAGASGPGPQVRDREDALKVLIRARAEALHVTPLLYCWFINPDQARCLKGLKDKSKPIVGSCERGKCPNATIHAEQAPVWVSGLGDLRRTLSDRHLPAGERARLTAKADEMQAVVDGLGVTHR
jgi:hypothetical protein